MLVDVGANYGYFTCLWAAAGRGTFLEAWSYRIAFFSDLVGLAFQAATFKIFSPSAVPEFRGTSVSYLEFDTIGIAISMFVGLGLVRAASASRDAQLNGTLEVLLMTPTAPTTIQLGLAYDLIYMPLRTAVFFAVIVMGLDVRFEASGLLPAVAILLFFVPFVWGLGIILSAATMTFKRGGEQSWGRASRSFPARTPVDLVRHRRRRPERGAS